MSKHTSISLGLPWRVINTGRKLSSAIVDNDGLGIAKEIHPEDAAHIVHCVNMYEELVDLLTKAREKLQIECGGYREYKGGSPTQFLLPAIDAILAKVKSHE